MLTLCELGEWLPEYDHDAYDVFHEPTHEDTCRDAACPCTDPEFDGELPVLSHERIWFEEAGR